MDPLLDEKIILTVSHAVPDFFLNTLGIFASREAYGPSKNEGLCYEKCTSVELTGEISGKLFFAMDGYTKVKILPYIANAFQMHYFRQVTSSLILQEFANQICGRVVGDLSEAGFKLDMREPKTLDNRLVEINRRKYRQYIIIYFLKDTEKKKYLGRLYSIIILEKHNKENGFPEEKNQERVYI